MSTILNQPSFRRTFFSYLNNSDPNISGVSQVQDDFHQLLTVGSAAGNVDGLITGQFTVVSGTPVTLDFTNPAGVTGIDVFGVAAPAGHLMGWGARVLSTTSGGATLAVGGGTNAIYGAIPVALELGASHEWDSLLGTGIVIGSSTKNLIFTASAGTITVDFSAFTRSA